VVAMVEVDQLQRAPPGRSKDGQGAPARLLVSSPSRAQKKAPVRWRCAGDDQLAVTVAPCQVRVTTPHLQRTGAYKDPLKQEARPNQVGQ